MHSIYLKTKIHSGIGSLQVLSKYKDQKIFLVCDNFLLKNGGVRQLLEVIDSTCDVKIFHQVVPDPPLDTVAKALAQFQHFAPQVMIALGGGSAIDTAKGVLYFSRQMSGSSHVKLIAVPTTSGTGSEVTSVTVLTDTHSKIKHMVVEESIMPDEAILDARLVLSVPPQITANTGMDVFTHALEAYVATGSNPFSDAMAEKAVEFVRSSLFTCYSKGDDLQARGQMHEASTFAGIAFDKAGLGLSHSIAHQLGGIFHIPHGLANAIVLKDVVLHNSKDLKVRSKYAKLACHTGISSANKNEEEAVWDLVRCIEHFKFQMKMPGTVRDCGISRRDYNEAMPTLAINALKDWCMTSNPTRIEPEDIAKLLNSIY
ncbi:1-propanol dehydrogenase PduQ [Clostridium merdae]|uniref:1-propanol dehydrogenase PduQ n=1 Tax=Clostridium merdae TaxID=1958780 RepID=UPI000A267704|nr:1-propanol dehydrogenase PduQ [Clostridium merdae]